MNVAPFRNHLNNEAPFAAATIVKGPSVMSAVPALRGTTGTREAKASSTHSSVYVGPVEVGVTPVNPEYVKSALISRFWIV
jgi:hypothetical protein